MGTLQHNFLHRVARPIALHEFTEALRAIAPPRFPSMGNNIPRCAGLAVSGGVDSMALAYLASRLRLLEHNFPIGDNPLSFFRSVTVDHGLRQGSAREAAAVRVACRAMHILAETATIRWRPWLAEYGVTDPKHLPNFETIARRLRYQQIARVCGTYCIDSLLVAHHEDDQYETVLMRLMNGHNPRGLRGMKTASDVPECEGVYGAYRSGFWDDQNQPRPYYRSNPTRRYRNRLRRDLRSQIDFAMQRAEERESLLAFQQEEDDFEELYQLRKLVPVDVPEIKSEDGGLRIYRPLLEFPKDRLVATCEANNVPWWEDHTNSDATVTARNAVRNMVKHYNIPLALQKPSVLALSRRCEQRAQALDAEANRLLAKTIIHDMDHVAGTVTVQFPEYGLSRCPRDAATRDPLRRRARIERQRDIASHVVQQVINLVTPDAQVPIANLQNTTPRLFPSLADSPTEPKAFVVAGVHCVPVLPDSRKGRDKGSLTWYLSRAPYPQNQPLPRIRTGYWAFIKFQDYKGGHGRQTPTLKWSKPTLWELWDGRYWIRLQHRLPYRVIVQPFSIEHAKKFRDLLAPHDRERLAVLLKRFAPGKVRYTLPALYLEEDLDLDNVDPRPWYPIPPAHVQEWRPEPGEQRLSEHPKVPDHSKMKLVALPTLEVAIPKLEEWLEYEIRYKRADRSTLRTAGSFHRSSFDPPGRYSGSKRKPGIRERKRRKKRGVRPLRRSDCVRASVRKAF